MVINLFYLFQELFQPRSSWCHKGKAEAPSLPSPSPFSSPLLSSGSPPVQIINHDNFPVSPGEGSEFSVQHLKQLVPVLGELAQEMTNPL